MIQELMIINQAGIALFYHNFVNKDRIKDEQTLASYFDIICRFTKREFNESLNILTLDSFIFFFYTHSSSFHLVLKCDNKDIDKNQLQKFSKTIIDKFLINYNDFLEDFNGEISIFKPFSKEIEKIINSQFKEFKLIATVE